MATGLARGARDRGKRIAFGDCRKIIWGPHAEPMFRHNPNIAAPGTLRKRGDIEWCDHYCGHRAYNRAAGDRWIWNLDFKAIPGEIFFDTSELATADKCGGDFIVIEPNIPANKPWAKNKQWQPERYQAIAYLLVAAGHHVVQFNHRNDGVELKGVEQVPIAHFRDALAWLSRAALYIGPEGGLHHGAAAVGTKAVVIFGGFIPASVTGYDDHTNLFVGDEACGSMKECGHCRDAMESIGIDSVFQPAMEMLAR